LFNCSELRTAPGPRQGTVWAAQDMTENMRVQEELLAAKEAAERASEAKSAFLAAMSHELRTPLNAILGFSQLIEAEISESPTPVPWASYVEHIEKAGDHLLALINQVLDLSRIDACAMPLDLEVFEIAGAAADVVDSARPLAAGNGNVIGVECEPARIRGDRLRVRQCLFNLVGNACKFTEQGTVSVRGRLEESRGAAWYVIAVTDTGIGIQPADLGKLFVDFSQVDDSSTRKHGGTGLGLAISRRLCRLMGGDITVESAPGRGSTFTMRIPADAVRREPADAERGEAAEVEMAG
jgi:signal transduction histidine kinase